VQKLSRSEVSASSTLYARVDTDGVFAMASESDEERHQLFLKGLTIKAMKNIGRSQPNEIWAHMMDLYDESEDHEQFYYDMTSSPALLH
jgi:hypothetical protein